MPDFGTPVVGPQTAVNPLQSLSQLLAIKAQQQGLAGQAAEVQQSQQSARQRAGLANFMQSFDPTKHVGSDGTLDLDSVLTDPRLRAAAGDQFPAVVDQMVGIKQHQLQSKQQLANLNDTLRNQFSSTVGSLRTDPDVVQDNQAGRAKVKAAMDNFSQTGGPDAARVAATYGAVVDHAPHGKLSQALSIFQMQAMDASTQAGRQAPSYVGAGNRLEQTNPQAAGGAPSGNISVGIPPGWVQYEDPVTHAQYIRNLQTGESRPVGSTYGVGTAPSTPKPNGPQSAPPNYKPGEAQTIAANTAAGGQRYNDLVTAAADSPSRVNVLDNVIRLAPQVRTGLGSGFKASMATVAGQIPGFSGAADDAAAYNEMAKFLHQSALRSWQSAGGTGTDAQLHTIEGANPNTSQDPRTIEALARYNKAGELALQAKATAHQTWLHQPGNNFANQDQFEQQWRQNFDPVLFQLKTATPEEAQKLLKGLSQAQLDELGRKQVWLKGEGVY